jgi:hypothetical protein
VKFSASFSGLVIPGNVNIFILVFREKIAEIYDAKYTVVEFCVL